jgi:hypothetical protein
MAKFPTRKDRKRQVRGCRAIDPSCRKHTCPDCNRAHKIKLAKRTPEKEEE